MCESCQPTIWFRVEVDYEEERRKQRALFADLRRLFPKRKKPKPKRRKP